MGLTMCDTNDMKVKAINFMHKVRPRLTTSELQILAALVIYLESGDENDIPGERSCYEAVRT